MTAKALDRLDRDIINSLQGGFPLVERPFAQAAERLGCGESELIARIQGLLERGVLSRFGPLFNAEKMGGDVTLAALAVPEVRFEEITERVNSYPEVAHNYRREHEFNMWFVISCERPERIAEVLDEIAAATGLPLINLPKEEEYFLELKLSA